MWRSRTTSLHSGMAATTALLEALNQGISSGNFTDTKIILCSHKDPSGRVGRPKALYANSRVLKTVSYFNDCEHAITHHATHPDSHCTVLVSAVRRFRGVPVEGLERSG